MEEGVERERGDLFVPSIVGDGAHFFRSVAVERVQWRNARVSGNAPLARRSQLRLFALLVFDLKAEKKAPGRVNEAPSFIRVDFHGFPFGFINFSTPIFDGRTNRRTAYRDDG